MENQLLLIPANSYSIDTNVFIDIWGPSNYIFSKSKMPELWDHIERLVEDGRIFATREVYDELKRHATPELLTWLKNHKEMFVLDKAQIEAAAHIINNVYSKYKEGYRPDVMNGADPFVVATAITKSAVVFTQEHEQQPGHNPSEVNCPKIPTVCDTYGVECVNIEKFIEREGFKLSMVDTKTLGAQPSATFSTIPALQSSAIPIPTEKATNSPLVN